MEVTDQDEIDELVQLVQVINDKKLSGDSQASAITLNSGNKAESGKKFTDPKVKAIIASALKASKQSKRKVFVSDSEVFIRVWDCGGQPVFLNILPAFLTARTLFLLMFDARHDLQSPCSYLSHFKGKATKEQEGGITTLELMLQWMATIHATLVKKKSPDSEASSSNEDGKFPQVLPIGTHGDDEHVRAQGDAVFNSLSSACADKAFVEYLLDGIIVDNTTAGKGELADSAFQQIRAITDKFASTDVSIRTPVRWVLFRKVFERYAKGKPVVPLEEVEELCRACLIPDESVASVLAFYHDLAVFFHYSEIPSLKSVVISDPQWLVRQMAKIMALKGCEVVKRRALWKLLREKGILVESLYKEVLATQNKLSPQQIIDLLEHFLIIAEIHTVNIHQCSGREYFVPSMLPRCPASKASYSATSNFQSAVPLHLFFSTNYLPPGFFTRLVAVMSKHPKCHVDFNNVYRNVVIFYYGSSGQLVDKVVIIEMKYSICIQVQRITPLDYPTFINACNDLFETLKDSLNPVREWLPGTDVKFGLKCENCPQKDHFIHLPALPDFTPNPILLCQKNVPTMLNPDQKFWFNIHQVRLFFVINS